METKGNHRGVSWTVAAHMQIGVVMPLLLYSALGPDSSRNARNASLNPGV